MPTMLLIDDHSATVMFIRSILPPHASWQIITATDGLQGLTLMTAQHDTIDVIVLDIYLPGLDGRLLYPYIQTLAPTVPVIGISSDTLALTELTARGCFAVVPKPLRRVDFLNTLDRALALRDDGPRSRGSTAAARTSFDQQIVPNAQLQDLDLHAVEQHVMTAIAHRDYDGPTDPVAFLMDHGAVALVDGALVPTYAGLLMFADHPTRWLPGAGVDVAQFANTLPSVETMGFRQTITGSLTHVLTRTLDVVWALIPHHTRLARSIERIEDHTYPRLVLRELTVNALCHRDWSLSGAAIQIRVFPDRIEWITPGGLPSGVTVATLQEAQVARNPVLTRLLYQAGYIEQYGLGMDMVYQVLATRGYPPPSAHDSPGWFSFHVFGSTHAPVGALTLGASFDLTPRQRRIVECLSTYGVINAHDLASILAVAPRSVQRDLAILVEQGTVQAIGDSRARRYRVISSP